MRLAAAAGLGMYIAVAQRLRAGRARTMVTARSREEGIAHDVVDARKKETFPFPANGRTSCGAIVDSYDTQAPSRDGTIPFHPKA